MWSVFRSIWSHISCFPCHGSRSIQLEEEDIEEHFTTHQVSDEDPLPNGKHSTEEEQTETVHPIDEYLHQLNQLGLIKSEKSVNLAAMMKTVFDGNHTLISIDMEGCSKGVKEVSEIGVSVYVADEQRGSSVPFIRLAHIIIRHSKEINDKAKTTAKLFNGKTSLCMTTNQVQLALNGLILEHSKNNTRGEGICIVGHGLSNELRVLTMLKVNVGQARTIDTSAFLCQTHGPEYLSLGNALLLMRLPYAFLHNAGNDAYYALLLCICLANPTYRSAARIDEKVVMEEFFKRNCRKLNNYLIESCRWKRLQSDLRSHTLEQP